MSFKIKLVLWLLKHRSLAKYASYLLANIEISNGQWSISSEKMYNPHLAKFVNNIKADGNIYITKDETYPDGSFKRLSGYVGKI